MSFSNRILIGLASGVALGLFLGEYARALQWAADGFVKLLQMTVLPYVTVSIVSSLGALRISEARALGLRAGAVVLGLWLLALVFAFLLPLAFPRFESASFFSTTLVEERPTFDFIGLYIPSNPFYSLANNIVPAVVLFSVLLGVALIGVEQKQALLGVLGVLSEGIARATRFIVRLTPYGLFAVAAAAAGTLSLEQVERLQVYRIWGGECWDCRDLAAHRLARWTVLPDDDGEERLSTNYGRASAAFHCGATLRSRDVAAGDVKSPGLNV